jgi:putative phosphoribosyl transferase
MFRDRREAGERLVERLEAHRTEHPVVVGLPRGGVEVAARVAEGLAAALDIIVVRKLGCPWQPELGIGAIAEGGIRILNDSLVADLRIGPADLAAVTEREQDELERRVARYRVGRPAVELAGRTVIIVDDGLATGYTARAAIEAVRAAGAGRVILAVPVAPAESVAALRAVADEVIALETPPAFFAIGQFYDDFSQLADGNVVAFLEAADRRAGLAAEAGPEVPAAPRPRRQP